MFRPMPASRLRPSDRIRLPLGRDYPILEVRGGFDDGRLVVVYDTERSDRGGRRVLGSLAPVSPDGLVVAEQLRSVT